MESMASWGCQHRYLPSCRCTTVTLLWLWVSLSSCTLCIHSTSVLMGYCKDYMQMRWQWTSVNMHIAHTPSAHTPTPLPHWTLFIKYKLKDKIVNNFGIMTAANCSWVWTSVWLHRLDMLKPALTSLQPAFGVLANSLPSISICSKVCWPASSSLQGGAPEWQHAPVSFPEDSEKITRDQISNKSFMLFLLRCISEKPP